MAETEEGSLLCRRQSVPQIRKVLKNVSDEITDAELLKLIFLAQDELPKGQTQNMNCLQLFSALEERQLIDTKNSDLGYLLELLGQLPRNDLIKTLNSALPPSKRGIITEEISENISCDAVVVSRSTAIHLESHVPVANQHVDFTDNKRHDGFLQDPDLVNSTFLKYHETVAELETVSAERDNALKKLRLSETGRVELQKKVNGLEMDMIMTRDEQNNLICERNSALASKSEWVFKESETRKELSDLKRTKNLLETSLSKTNSEVEKQEVKIKELKEKLEKSQNEVKVLKCELESMKISKELVEKELKKMQDRVEEGNGRIKCKRCGLIFLETNNPVDACRYHSGTYGVTGALMKKMEWSCCKNANKSSPGCCKKKHLSIDYQLSPGQDKKDVRKEKLDIM